MKNVIQSLYVTISFLASVSQAARIVDIQWIPQSQKIQVVVDYRGGCETHNFRVQWETCEMDMNTRINTRFGLLLDSAPEDTCEEELQQTVEASEPKDGCFANTIVLKSTSSKVPFVLSR